MTTDGGKFCPLRLVESLKISIWWDTRFSWIVSESVLGSWTNNFTLRRLSSAKFINGYHRQTVAVKILSIARGLCATLPLFV